MGRFVLKVALKGGPAHVLKQTCGNMQGRTELNRVVTFLAQTQPRGVENSATWCVEKPRGVDSALSHFCGTSKHSWSSLIVQSFVGFM